MSDPRGVLTTLSFGLIRADVKLYKTTDDPPDFHFESAGPNGGALVQTTRQFPREGASTDVLTDASTKAFDEGVEQVQQYEAALTEARGKLASLDALESREVLVEEGTGAVVAPDRVRRGIRTSEGKFIDLTDQLSAIDENVKMDEMRIVSFIDVGQVPRERVCGSYYLASGGPGAPKVLRLLYEAMKASRRVAVVKWSKTKNQALGVLVPHPSGALIVLQVVWSAAWRKPSDPMMTHKGVLVSSSEIDSACKLIKALSSTRTSLDELEDDRVRLRAELVDSTLTESAFAIPDEVRAASPDAGVSELLQESIERADELASA